MYSEKQIKSLFEKIRNDSYSDCLSSQIVIEEMGFVGYSSPFTGNVSINLNRINTHKYPKKAIVGIIAHELAHQVSYRKRSFASRWLFLWNYYFSEKKRNKIEMEADEIAVMRGYGEDILFDTEFSYTYLINDKKLFEFIKRVYPSPQDIRNLIKKCSKIKK